MMCISLKKLFVVCILVTNICAMEEQSDNELRIFEPLRAPSPVHSPLLHSLSDEEGYGSKRDFKEIQSLALTKSSGSINPQDILLRVPAQQAALKRSLDSSSFSGAESSTSDSEYCESSNSSSKSRKTDQSSIASPKVTVKIEPMPETPPTLVPAQPITRSRSSALIMEMCVFAGCTKVFETPRDFYEHIKTHTEGMPYACIHPNCPQSFITIGNWVLHMRTHINTSYSISPEEIEKMPFPCIKSSCTNTSDTVAEWIAHHKSNHGVEKSYPCLQAGCRRVFPEASGLKMHMRNHADMKPFICTHQDCPRAFSREIDLINHMKSHVPNKFVCTNVGCIKVCLSQSSFTRHLTRCKPQIKCEPVKDEPEEEL